MTRGFTLVELLVSVGIFALMTALVVAKYSTFNQSVLLTNLAYDVALSVRTAQTYGLSVTQADTASGNLFKYAYGISFSEAASRKYATILYGSQIESDTIGIKDAFDTGDLVVARYNIKRGAYISDVCAGTDESHCTGGFSQLDVVFRRPDPAAIICANANCTIQYPYGRVTLMGTDGSTRTVSVLANGQVSVGQ